ncbi:MAG: FKBP-type peptidyl-prolyl cis-trans isomerase [Candidatus Kaiserbacteria bacterium]|nr:FKBP-type peptidyl-prolyl cis-trans isomerase [Candidatus Kaiserbacteria bacterium]
MNTKNIIIGIVVIVVIGVIGYYVSKASSASKGADAQTPDATTGQQAAESSTSDQVQGQEVKVGTGAEAKPGMQVTVEYTGKLADGTVFDTNVGKDPLVFTLGAQGIIPGFQVGVNGMKVGGERLIAIPPSLGYGAQKVGTIPPNSTLIFQVKLLKVEAAPATATP